MVVAGCVYGPVVSSPEKPTGSKGGLAPIGYSIQVGAFSHLDNAVRLSQKLQAQGLNAYYFVHKTGLYKVRFGSFLSRKRARIRAESLHVARIIDEYYIVGPEDYPTLGDRRAARSHVRGEIVRTARSYLGLPYRWGGDSPEHGFDCSGLAMVAYQLNGLDLPRASKEQWMAGSPVDRSQLSKADLVFFSTSRRGRISHVGIYVGNGRFIHAPGMGKNIRLDSLSTKYFRRHYVGARTYF
jgi:cell wall-associated NlpC family hydrolase